jgi:3-oxoacyl-[acyl-carrier protein] reductase
MVPCDVADFAGVEAAFRFVRAEAKNSFFGLVNAAGIASMNLVMMTPPETMVRLIGVNLLGCMYCSQQGGKLLARRGSGRIINFSTIAVPLALKGEAVYAASKAGVETFSRAFAREMGDHGVTVNCIAPGPIDTALIAKVPAANIERIVSQQIITRKAEPDDVWDTVSLLLSAAAGMVTGEVLHVGGA